ncbi:MAG TPA: hypothetical protein VM118_12805 [Acidobacteriota bacterium]|nr:hypothetical protein [Acidobacteriota bacterium]
MWMILPPIEADAATQMAIDAVLLDRCETDTNAGFIRFYRMTPPAVTIGRNQRWQKVIDPTACQARGWAWVRRPTGGGALLHADEVNYAIAVGRRILKERGLSGFRSVFEWIAGGLADSVRSLGLQPIVSAGSRESMSRGRPGGTRQHGLCGKSLTQYEIAESGRKLLASAQLLTSHGVLQHGTIYLKAPGDTDRFWPKALSINVLRTDAPQGIRPPRTETATPRRETTGASQRWTDLGPVAQDRTWEQIAAQLTAGLLEALGLEPAEHPLSESDLRAVSAIRESWQIQGWHTRR